MWLLIVVTTFYAHSGGKDPSNFAFETFKTKERCEEIAKWVNTEFGPAANQSHPKVRAQCVFKEKE